jgi:hypothetical protein
MCFKTAFSLPCTFMLILFVSATRSRAMLSSAYSFKDLLDAAQG